MFDMSLYSSKKQAFGFFVLSLLASVVIVGGTFLFFAYAMGVAK